MSVRVVLCSKSAVKMRATMAAIERLGIEVEVAQREARSGVPEQPYEEEDWQILSGALCRALDKRYADSFVVAVESGIVPRGCGFCDLAYVAVVAPDGRISTRRSASVGVPIELVERSRDSGWQITAGKLEAARTPGCDHADPHVVWSGGRTSRFEILADAIERALRDVLSDGGLPPSRVVARSEARK